jgi:hypothetical protein
MRRAIRFFFAAGPGNVIQAHKNWRDGLDDPGQMSVTFSSEFESLCRDLGAASYIVSSASPSEIYRDGDSTIEHRPKLHATGWKYHLSELSYGFRRLYSIGLDTLFRNVPVSPIRDQGHPNSAQHPLADRTPAHICRLTHHPVFGRPVFSVVCNGDTVRFTGVRAAG